jgi:hypothetical protein
VENDKYEHGGRLKIKFTFWFTATNSWTVVLRQRLLQWKIMDMSTSFIWIWSYFATKGETRRDRGRRATGRTMTASRVLCEREDSAELVLGRLGKHFTEPSGVGTTGGMEKMRNAQEREDGRGARVALRAHPIYLILSINIIISERTETSCRSLIVLESVFNPL